MTQSYVYSFSEQIFWKKKNKFSRMGFVSETFKDHEFNVAWDHMILQTRVWL